MPLTTEQDTQIVDIVEMQVGQSTEIFLKYPLKGAD